MLVAQLCQILCNPMNCPPGSSVHGILQTRTLEWVAVPSPGDLPDPGFKPGSPASQAGSLPAEPSGKLWCGEWSSSYNGVGVLMAIIVLEGILGKKKYCRFINTYLLAQEYHSWKTYPLDIKTHTWKCTERGDTRGGSYLGVSGTSVGDRGESASKSRWSLQWITVHLLPSRRPREMAKMLR